MTDFKVGDTAKVDGSKTVSPRKWEGLEFAVTYVDTTTHGDYQLVTGVATSLNHPAAYKGRNVRFRSTQLYPKAASPERIQVGDLVQYTGPDARLQGVKGTVEGESLNYGTATIVITVGNSLFNEGQLIYPKLYNLEKVQPFTFADIKVGDKVRRTEKWDDTGTTMVVEGVVETLSLSRATTKEGHLLGARTDRPNPHVTLELLERPEPHFTETAEVGTRYRVKSTFDFTNWFVMTKQDDGSWERLNPRNGNVDTYVPKAAKEYFDEREHAIVK